MSHSFSVFIIDDDRVYQFTAKKMLESTGLVNSVTGFFDGQEALDFILNSNVAMDALLPDIIFLDIYMPVVDGWTFLKAYENILAKSSKKPRLYIISSSIEKEDLEKSKLFKYVTNYINKPLKPSDYRNIILGQT